MFDDYNSNFTIVYSYGQECLSPTDKGFDQHLMLYEEYFVYDDATLVISAPDNCSFYTWTFTDPDKEYEEVVVNFRDITGPVMIKTSGTTYDRKVMAVYVPESNLEIGKTYKLTLTIVDTGGNTFTDSCGVIIYKRYIR